MRPSQEPTIEISHKPSDKNPDDQPIAHIELSILNMFPHRMAMFARGLLRQDGRLYLVGFGPFLTALSFDDDNQTPTAEGAGRDALLVEPSHRGHESREGGLEHHTSEGCFWLRQCPAHHDQGMFFLSQDLIFCIHMLPGLDG